MTGPDVLLRSGFSPATSMLVRSKMTATSDVYRNADGSFTRRFYTGVVNYRTAAGQWAPIDTTLVPGSGGRLRERGNSLRVSLAPASGGGNLLSLRLPGGSLSLGLAGSARSAGRVSGSSVIYPQVLPGTDLRATGDLHGMSVSLVDHSAAAGGGWVLSLRLHGLSAAAAGAGTVVVRNAAGKTVWVFGPGYAQDSRPSRSGMPAQTGVAYRLIGYRGSLALAVRVSRAWLDSAARVFPVTVTVPGLVPVSRSGPHAASWTGCSANCSATEYADASTFVMQPFTDAAASYPQVLKVGYDGSGSGSSAQIARTFLDFGTFGSDLRDLNVTKVQLSLFNAYDWTCSAEPFDVAFLTQKYSTSSPPTTYPGLSYQTPVLYTADITPSSTACNNTNWASNPNTQCRLA